MWFRNKDMKRIVLFIFLFLPATICFARNYEEGGIRYIMYHLNPEGNYSSDWGLIASEVTDPSANMEIARRFEYTTGGGFSITPVYEYVKGIEEGIFDNCIQLEKLTINIDVDYNYPYDSPGFKGCENLSQFAASKSSGFTVIDGALYKNNSLWAFPTKPREKYNIPTSAKSLGVRAFAYCRINNLNVPESIETFGEDCFKEFCGNVAFNRTYDEYDFLTNIDNRSVIVIADPSEGTKVRKFFKGGIDGLVKITSINESYGGVKFCLEMSDLLALDAIKSVKLGGDIVQAKENIGSNNYYEVDNLKPGTSYQLEVRYLDDNKQERILTKEISTETIETQSISAILKDAYCGGFDLDLSGIVQDLNPSDYEYGVCVDEREFFPFENAGHITISGLIPATYYEIKPYVKYADTYYYGAKQRICTRDIAINIGYKNSKQQCILPDLTRVQRIKLLILLKYPYGLIVIVRRRLIG